MKNKTEILNKLSEAGVIEAICWIAYDSFIKTQDLISPSWGHQAATKGTLNYNHFTMGMNTVFHVHTHQSSSADELHTRQLYPHALTSARSPMPEMTPGIVTGRIVENTHVWQFENVTLLLQSCPPGEEEKINWSQKGRLKRQAAATPSNQQPLPLEEWTSSDLTESASFSIDPQNTLIILHSYDPETNIGRVFIGKSKLRDTPEDSAWEWLEEIYSHPQMPLNRQEPATPLSNATGATLTVDDAPIQLKQDFRDKDAN